MIIFSNIKKLYDGTSETSAAIQKGVDLWVEDGNIHALKPHDAVFVVHRDAWAD